MVHTVILKEKLMQVGAFIITFRLIFNIHLTKLRDV